MNRAWQCPSGFSFRGALTLGLAIVLMGLTAQRAVSAGEPAELQVLIFRGVNKHGCSAEGVTFHRGNCLFRSGFVSARFRVL